MILLASAVPNLGLQDICLRLLCAMVVGMVIGTEREYTHRPAGMRTHILVALGASSVMIIGQMIFAEYSAYGASPDPARLAAQVITGVGFLGAGTIMREGANVKGLTTAASLWAVACLGIASGAGYYTVALLGMVFIFITLTIFEFLQDKLIRGSIHCSYSVRTAQLQKGFDAINTLAEKNHCTVHVLSAEQVDGDHFLIRFQVSFRGRKASLHQKDFFEALAHSPSIKSVHTGTDTVNAK